MDSEVKNDGVTLIELIIVIAIIGIIALFVTMDVSWFMRDTRLSEARDRLLADIEDVKLKSLTRIPYGIIVTGGNNTSYRLVTLTAAAGNDFKRDPGDGIIDSETAVSLPTNVRVSWNNNTVAELWFDRKGIPRSDTWLLGAGTFTVWYDEDSDGAFDATEPNKTIIISSGGRIQYEVK